MRKYMPRSCKSMLQWKSGTRLIDMYNTKKGTNYCLSPFYQWFSKNTIQLIERLF